MNKESENQQDTVYTDISKSPAERAAALLQELTLDEKMAQLGCIFPFGENYDDIDRKSVV